MHFVTVVEIAERLTAEGFRFIIGPSLLLGILLMIIFNNL